MPSSHFRGNCRALQSLSHRISWKPTGKRQQTLASEVRLSGVGLHSGEATTARLRPAMAGEGRYFVASDGTSRIPATIDHAVNSPLCTTLCCRGASVRTVEHLLSALEACGVDNCRIEIEGGEEVPILDGSAKCWVEAIEHIGLLEAVDYNGATKEKMVPALYDPEYIFRDGFHALHFCLSPSVGVSNDCVFVAFVPKRFLEWLCLVTSLSSQVLLSNIHLDTWRNASLLVARGLTRQVPAIDCQWFSCSMDTNTYSKEIASSRTFCIYEEISLPLFIYLCECDISARFDFPVLHALPLTVQPLLSALTSTPLSAPDILPACATCKQLAPMYNICCQSELS
ncbi:putative UDP-3-O-[3-hydroxymyristoyl] N-acetylglucosamine deacetylase 5 [Apostasia shenzhenica]|uniref:UDP-3-O-acyl-N-acetylglucosamine deacetylase n=1 Tax=Apostasia shenzhenica TaxID=1088818 RepID=A0A2I0A9K3_9ASPA|nr:putative UDP-3-O-[3-hydroxymyristoyl] N-acetylglucosamine deacetylase 5 [Apostasia shenzhenica]